MMQSDLKRALNPVEFSKYVSVAPDEWQETVLKSTGKRLLLNCCRQSGKSTIAAVKALHTGIYKPKSVSLLASPGQKQSQELLVKIKECMDNMESPPVLTEDNKLSIQFANGSRIIALHSDEKTIRGLTADLIIEDEAARVSDEYYNALLPMLMIKKGTLILMSTPFGKRGHFFKEWMQYGDDWERITVTGEECPRIDEAEMDKQRRSRGEMFFRQEYMCEFVDTVNTVFSYDLIQAAFRDDIEPLYL